MRGGSPPGSCSTSSRARTRQRSARPSAATGTFADLASQYVELWAKKHNKSWKQAEKLVARHLLPRWGKMKATAVTRADVRAVMIRVEAPIVANQTLGCQGQRDLYLGGQAGDHRRQSGCHRGKPTCNPTGDARAWWRCQTRSLWHFGLLLDAGLELILLMSGQRPGEVAAMAREHIVDGWWQMPGKPPKQ